MKCNKVEDARVFYLTLLNGNLQNKTTRKFVCKYAVESCEKVVTLVSKCSR
jgi:hypothetical protein